METSLMGRSSLSKDVVMERGAVPFSGVTACSELVPLIRAHWPNVYFGAVPYLEAMEQLNTLDPEEPYIAEKARSIVLYFLANAQTWRGPVAREVKAFLNKKYGYGKR